ncbi:MAG: hypothetical protein KTR25_21055 [Myxococcales bacterium]|nr:hypothetical protein [Myxococcales bacterium]
MIHLRYLHLYLITLVLTAWSPEQSFAQLSSHSELASEAFLLIRTWQIETVRPKILQLQQNYPNHPITNALVGQFKFHLGDHSGAAEAFKKAHQNGAPPQFLLDTDAALSASKATKGYLEYVGTHFIIRHHPGKDALLVPFALEALDAARNEIGNLLGWKPSEKVVVEIYPTAKTLAAVSALTSRDIETSGTIALCRWNRLMITTPRAIVFGYAWRDTLAHELAHLIIGNVSHDTVPIWLHEGLAKYTETSWRGEPGLGISVDQQKKLRQAAENRALISFEEMHPSMAKLPSQEAASLAFTEVFTFVEFLVDMKGWSSIRSLLKTLAANQGQVEEAMRSVYGAPLKALELRWKRSLLKREIRPPKDHRPVSNQRQIVVKNSPETPDDQLHGLSDLARRYARAADLLYARGRYIAAQKELEKAFSESGAALVSAKLATLALANNDLARAEEAARRSIEAMPELAGPNVTLAEILLLRNDREGMKLPLARAIDINPFDPRIHQLTLSAEGTNGEPATRKRAQAALALTQSERGSLEFPSLGTGARLKIEGMPFSRVYFSQQGQRISTLSVTPTSVIEIRPGQWTLEIEPPQGKTIQRELSLSASESVKTIRLD